MSFKEKTNLAFLLETPYGPIEGQKLDERERGLFLPPEIRLQAG